MHKNFDLSAALSALLTLSAPALADSSCRPIPCPKPAARCAAGGAGVALMLQIRCWWSGQSIADSDAELRRHGARCTRRIAAGESRADSGWLIDRYGALVTYEAAGAGDRPLWPHLCFIAVAMARPRPPAEATTMIVWILVLWLRQLPSSRSAMRQARRSTLRLWRRVSASPLPAMSGRAPSLAGKPARPRWKTSDPDRRRDVRGASSPILGQFDQLRGGSAWRQLSCAGDSLRAAQILRSGIREHPARPRPLDRHCNACFCTRGEDTPACEFAFDRAQQLAPAIPPRCSSAHGFRAGRGLCRSRAAWRQDRANAAVPTASAGRERLQLVRQLLAMQAMQQSTSKASEQSVIFNTTAVILE